MALVHATSKAKGSSAIHEAEGDLWFETEFSPLLGAVYHHLGLLSLSAAETLAKSATESETPPANVPELVAEHQVKARRLLARAVMLNPEVPAFWKALTPS